MKNIAVIGAGYVGLVTGACFAQKGNKVTIIENNQDKIDQLLAGKIPFYEPYLATIVTDALAKKTITFVTNIRAGLAQKPDIIFSCVGTPSLPNGAADLSYVEAAAREIGATLDHYVLVVNKSTVPVGTAHKVKAIILQELAARNIDIPFDVASNPEFLKEGDAVNDFLMPDRIVVGIESEIAASILHELYQPFITSQHQFITMSIASAELTKYASNAMLATRISFMNQLAHLADQVGADIEQIKLGMAKDKRIGAHFLNAVIGYGGSCFPKDVAALVHTGAQHHSPMTLVKEVENVNLSQRVHFIHQITSHYGPALATKTVGIWGLAFKPETDDIRCSPAIDVITTLLEQGANIVAYDQEATKNIQAIFGDAITYAPTAQAVLEQADFLVIITDWKEFVTTPISTFTKLKDKVVFDGRNCFSPYDMAAHGIAYVCVGRNTIIGTPTAKKLVSPLASFETPSYAKASEGSSGRAVESN